MPAKARKIRNKNRWRVTDSSGKVHAKSTTKYKADRQVSLLNRSINMNNRKDGSGKGIGRKDGLRLNKNKGGCARDGEGYGKGGGRGLGRNRKG